MAVTLTVAQFISDARIGATAEELELATRRVAYATEAVMQHLGDAFNGAPDVVVNEAVSRLAGYLYDAPTVAGGAAFANSMRNSGAGRILLPYRVHGLGHSDAVAEAQAAVGTDTNPVIGLAVAGDVLTVTFADGNTEELTLPASGVDQTARDAAAAAQADATTAQADATSALADAATAQTDADANEAARIAHAADANAHHVPPTGGGGTVSLGTRLPLGTTVMRLGWAQTQTLTAANFTRVDNHPTDGAAEGTVDGLQVPPFPPATQYRSVAVFLCLDRDATGQHIRHTAIGRRWNADRFAFQRRRVGGWR